jgi:anti-anti-sigma factor
MADALEVHVRRDGDVGILETDGYINDHAAEKVADAGEVLVQEGVKHVVLNLAKSRIVNSMGISILIEFIEKVRELEGKVAFCCVTPTLSKTFRIMGLLKVATICETEAEALEAVRSAT